MTNYWTWKLRDYCHFDFLVAKKWVESYELIFAVIKHRIICRSIYLSRGLSSDSTRKACPEQWRRWDVIPVITATLIVMFSLFPRKKQWVSNNTIQPEYGPARQSDPFDQKCVTRSVVRPCLINKYAMISCCGRGSVFANFPRGFYYYY